MSETLLDLVARHRARCTITYTERDGSKTACTRELDHQGACYWPELPEWRRRAMTKVYKQGNLAEHEL